MAKESGPNVETDDFRKGVNFIRDVLKDKKAKFYFEPAKTGIIFNKPPTKNSIRSYDINDEKIQDIVDEIIEIVSIILAGEKEEVISNIQEKEELVQTFKNRCEIVEKEIVDWNLIKRFHLQKNYKTSLLDKFDWDIIIKKKEFNNKELTFPTAMLRIRTRKPFSDSPPVMKTETFRNWN
jgi:hypothetical protein